MATKLKRVLTGTPRPFLEIVKALQLDSVQLPATVRSKPTKSKGGPPPAQAANDGNIPESGRNNTLTSMAGSMRRKGMTKVAIAAALHAENSARCNPPLDTTEVDGIAASIMRYPEACGDDLMKSLTDTGNATRFGLRHAGRVIYVAGQGWMIWDGLQWRRDDVERIMELAKQLSRSVYLEGEALDDNDARIAIAKHAKTSQQAPRLKAMLELSQSIPELVTHSAELDAHDMSLGVANGVINLKTGKLRAASPGDRITRHSPVVFDASATCPLFVNFLNQVTDGNKPLITYLQRVVGYCLTGNTAEQCLFFLYGNGANGKSTFLTVIKELLGTDLARQTPSETLMARKNSSATNDIARLIGVRVVIANEVEDGSLLAESLVKQMTGGEALTARFLYGEFVEFLPKFKLFIAGNHKPTIRGRDQGIWRRIRLIPFEVTIAPGQRDKHLQTKLRAELPGILNWALKGCLAWQKRGLSQPQQVDDAVQAYRSEMDLLGQWVADACVSGPAHAWQSRQAYGNYANWAQGGGYKPMSESIFSRELEGTFKKVRRKDANYFEGIAQKPFNP
jgi:putative DNA primase/helicase